MTKSTHNPAKGISPAERTAREALLWADGYAAGVRHIGEQLAEHSNRAGQRVTDLRRAPVR